MSLFDSGIAIRGEEQAIADYRKRLERSIATRAEESPRVEIIDGREYTVTVLPADIGHRADERLANARADRSKRMANRRYEAYGAKRSEQDRKRNAWR